MALRGLDIFKLSPKKNCKECGCPTCMAFCMKVAQGGETLEKCPYFSPEAKARLEAQSTPLMKTVTVGDGLELGGETVLFRHEKTLVNQNLFAVSLTEDRADETVSAVSAVDYTRINQRMYVELLCVAPPDGDEERYAALVKKAAATGRTLLLDTRDPALARAALPFAGKRPVLNGATPENYREMNQLAVQFGAVLGVWAESLSSLYDTVKALEALGNRDLLLDVTAATAKETLANAVLVRRTALSEEDRTFGYPSIVNICALAPGDPRLQTAYAAMFIEKYGSILILETMSYAQALPLFGLRQNIFTNPQRPMSVEARLYPINGADEYSPCLLTVDFALTYFLVAGEIERSNMPVNLLIIGVSGLSVLTAWAAGKLSASAIKTFFEEQNIGQRIKSRTLVIPGKVSVMQEEIREVLPEWNVVAGPAEASQLPKYLKEKAYEKETVRLTAAVSHEKTGEMTLDELLKTRVPPIPAADIGVRYKGRNPASKAFITVGERIHCISPVIRKAMDERDPAPILERAAEQIAAGAVYLDVNIGPAEKDGPERMMWAVKLLQENFDNVPLVLDTANKKAIEAGIYVYNRQNGKPVINSADAGARLSYIDLAAENDAVCIALCSSGGLPRDNEERMSHCHKMLEHGLSLGMAPEDLWFDPMFLVVKGMQDKQMEVLEAIRLFSQEGLKSTGGLSNNSNGAPKEVRPVLDSALIAMAMMQGLTSAIINPCDRRLMETIKSCDIFKNHVLYSDSYLKL